MQFSGAIAAEVLARVEEPDVVNVLASDTDMLGAPWRSGGRARG